MTRPRRALSPSVLPALLVVAACLSLQFGASFAVMLFETAGVWGVGFLRLAVAAIILLIATRPTPWTWSPRAWRAVIALGVSLGVMNGFFYASLGHLDQGVAVTIEFLGPLLLAAVLSRRLLEYVWVACALAGMGLLALDSLRGDLNLSLIGVGYVLVAAASWTVYILASRSAGTHIPGSGGVAVAMTIGAITLAPVGAPDAITALLHPGEQWLSLLASIVLMAVLASVIPYTLEMRALRSLHPSTFGVVLSVEPACAAFAGWVLLGQKLGLLPFLAIVLVITASAGATLTAQR